MLPFVLLENHGSMQLVVLVCSQCCNQPWVGLSGPSCLACEAKRCPAPPPAARSSEVVLEFERPVEEVEFALPSE